jgi:uncharacterized peroxidase-related enzyme
MEKLFIKTPDTVSGEVKESLERTKKRLGFVPNLIGVFANSPVTLEAYQQLDHHWSRSSFKQEEKEIVLLAASVENSCPYCIAGYSTALEKMNIEERVIKSIRMKQSIGDQKLDTLIDLVREIVGRRGMVTEATKERFLEVGYTKTQLVELLMAVALETMSNYLDHLMTIPIDEQYIEQA